MYTTLQFHSEPVAVIRNGFSSHLVRLTVDDTHTVVMPEHMWQEAVNQLAALGITADELVSA